MAATAPTDPITNSPRTYNAVATIHSNVMTALLILAMREFTW